MESALPNREGFENWLRRRPLGSCVGRLGDEADCPLARCLSAIHGRATVVASASWWFADEGLGSERPLAPWARAFVAALDETPKVVVSRERAIFTLARVAR